MRILPALCFLTTLTLTQRAFADQCALVDPQVATKAAELVGKSSKVLEFCEPCREKTPGTPYVPQKIEARDRSLYLDGKLVDLAYTYVHTKGNEFANLAAAAGCKAESVSATVTSDKPTRAPTPMSPTPKRPFPPGPPANRVTSVDDMSGTWTVTLRQSASTCATSIAKRDETWTIDASSGELVVTTASGDLTGALPVMDRYSVRASVQPKARASAAVIQLSQYLKDKLWGKTLRVESTGKRGDPACVVQEDWSAVRAP